MKARHDYLPFGEEILAGTAGRTASLGYVADNLRQKFTQKERDIESGLDYFLARYYSSAQGRFTSADEFFKDSQVRDPQSWNKYAYARNNPLKYIDPEGEKATVTIATDEKNKTGTITVTASIAVWTGDKSISQADLNRATADIKSSIDNAWKGTYQQDGITYTVTTDVTVTAAGSEKDATESGAQNVIELSNGPAGKGDSYVNWGSIFGGPDTGKWNINKVSTVAGHEFIHLMGVWDKEGQYLADTHSGHRPSPSVATGPDYGWALGGAITGHRAASRQYYGNGNSLETRSSPAFRLGPPENHRSSTELRAGRLWWN